MRLSGIFFILSAVVITSSAMGGEDFGPYSEVAAPIERIFAPLGFDDNDNAEVVLQGTLPSTCYKVGRAGAKIDVDARTIEVWSTVYHYPKAACDAVKVPFIQTVKLGNLPVADYTVVLASEATIQSTLSISARVTEAADEFLFAPVVDADISFNQQTGEQTLTVSGNYPHMFVGCMVMKEIRTELQPDDILVIRPIAELVDGEVCEKQPDDLRFKVSQVLPEGFHAPGLLHIRVLSGDSLNRYIIPPTAG